MKWILNWYFLRWIFCKVYFWVFQHFWRGTDFIRMHSYSFSSVAITDFFSVYIEYWNDYSVIFFPFESFSVWIICLLSSSLTSISMSSCWIFYLRLSERLTFGLILLMNLIECFLCDSHFLWERYALNLPGSWIYWRVGSCCRIWL